jgi:Tol biopolymer transport system component
LLAGLLAMAGCSPREDALREPQARQAEILYLAPSAKPEIWRVPATGGTPRQLTSTAGGVYDYAVSADGNQVIFSARNEQGGLDLWGMGREGDGAHVLLPCQVDWCFGPAISPDGSQVAHLRRQLASSASPSPGQPRVWLLDARNGSTDLLYRDPNIGGSQPAWSPDGAYLAFYDDVAGGIHVLNMETKQDFLLPAVTGPGGSWSPDSHKLLFANNIISEEGPESQVFLAEIETRQVEPMPGGNPAGVEYSAPSWSPAGDKMAVALGPGNGSAGKQIWVMAIDGTAREPVTQDVMVTNAAVSWSPAGDRLVFQRLALGSSDSLPSVAVWDSASGSLVSVAEGAFSPRWLP